MLLIFYESDLTDVVVTRSLCDTISSLAIMLTEANEAGFISFS